MRIHATFVTFKSGMPGDSPELLHAWDEYSIDSNPEGFDTTRTDALTSYGDDVDQVVDVVLEVPMKQLMERFTPARIPVRLVYEGDQS